MIRIETNCQNALNLKRLIKRKINLPLLSSLSSLSKSDPEYKSIDMSKSQHSSPYLVVQLLVLSSFSVTSWDFPARLSPLQQVHYYFSSCYYRLVWLLSRRWQTRLYLFETIIEFVPFSVAWSISTVSESLSLLSFLTVRLDFFLSSSR